MPCSGTFRPCVQTRFANSTPMRRGMSVTSALPMQNAPAPAVERRAKARLGRNETGDDARDKDQQEHARRDAAPHQHARAHPQIGPHSHG